MKDCDNCSCLPWACQELYANQTDAMELCYLERCFFDKTISTNRLGLVTAIYTVIFITGVVGNLSTCLVINFRLRSTTYSYLLSLAIADLITLVVGLPFEVYLIWHQYPWTLGDSVCNLKAWILESTSNVSVLTILAFSVERYIAVCHSMSLVTLERYRRRLPLILILIWTSAAALAIPYGIYHQADYQISSWPADPSYGPVKNSKMCMLALAFDPSLRLLFSTLLHTSAIFFFLLPLVVLTILYALIGHTVSRSNSTFSRRSYDSNSCLYNASTRTTSQRNNPFDFHSKKIIFMLVAVVGGFFLCYAPYQLQRLLFLYMEPQQLSDVNEQLYIISGILFYLASTVNPVLYNCISSRYRRALMDLLMGGWRNQRQSSLSPSRASAKPSRSLLLEPRPLNYSATPAISPIRKETSI